MESWGSHANGHQVNLSVTCPIGIDNIFNLVDWWIHNFCQSQKSSDACIFHVKNIKHDKKTTIGGNWKGEIFLFNYALNKFYLWLYGKGLFR